MRGEAASGYQSLCVAGRREARRRSRSCRQAGSARPLLEYARRGERLNGAMPLFRFANTQACSGIGNRHALVIDERGLHRHVAIRPLDDACACGDWSDRGGLQEACIETLGDRGEVGRERGECANARGGVQHRRQKPPWIVPCLLVNTAELENGSGPFARFRQSRAIRVPTIERRVARLLLHRSRRSPHWFRCERIKQTIPHKAARSICSSARSRYVLHFAGDGAAIRSWCTARQLARRGYLVCKRVITSRPPLSRTLPLVLHLPWRLRSHTFGLRFGSRASPADSLLCCK